MRVEVVNVDGRESGPSMRTTDGRSIGSDNDRTRDGDEEGGGDDDDSSSIGDGGLQRVSDEAEYQKDDDSMYLRDAGHDDGVAMTSYNPAHVTI